MLHIPKQYIGCAQYRIRQGWKLAARGQIRLARYFSAIRVWLGTGIYQSL